MYVKKELSAAERAAIETQCSIVALAKPHDITTACFQIMGMLFNELTQR